MNRIQLAVFDMAGTVVDENNVVYKTIQKAINEAGYDLTLEYVLLYGAGKEKHQAIKDILAQTKAENFFELSESIFKNFKVLLKDAYGSLQVTSFKGVEDLLAYLREEGIAIALNTGYNQLIAEQLLRKMNWKMGEHYDILVTADNVKNGRPYPDMINRAMQKLGVSDPAKVLKAGDSIIDIEEGKNANCGFTVAVTTGAHTREQLQSANPTLVVDSLYEIINLIRI